MFAKLKGQARHRLQEYAPHKFRFDVTVQKITGIPAAHKDVILAWTRGPKAQFTKPVTVKDGTAEINQSLVQVATLYRKSDGTCDKKDYSFKAQVVQKSKAAKGQDKITTFAKCEMDLAPFANINNHGIPQTIDIVLPVKGSSKTARAKATVICSWLKNYVVDPDQMTDAQSALDVASSLGGSSFASSGPRESTEQDLSGFAIPEDTPDIPEYHDSQPPPEQPPPAGSARSTPIIDASTNPFASEPSAGPEPSTAPEPATTATPPASTADTAPAHASDPEVPTPPLDSPPKPETAPEAVPEAKPAPEAAPPATEPVPAAAAAEPAPRSTAKEEPATGESQPAPVPAPVRVDAQQDALQRGESAGKVAAENAAKSAALREEVRRDSAPPDSPLAVRSPGGEPSQELQELQRDLFAARAEISKLSVASTAADSRNNRLQAQVAAAERAAAEAASKLQEAEGKLERAEGKLKELPAAEAVAGMRAQIAELEGFKAAAEKAAAQRDQILAASEGTQHQEALRLQALLEAAEAKARRVDEVEAAQAAQAMDVERLQQALEFADSQLEVQIRAHEKAVGEVRAEKEEAEALRAESEELYLQALEEKGEEVEELQKQLASLVLEATEHNKEMHTSVEEWKVREFRKAEEREQALQEQLVANEASIKELNETMSEHVTLLIEAKIELAEQKGKNLELKRHAERQKQKMASLAARYTALEAAHATNMNQFEDKLRMVSSQKSMMEKALAGRK